MSSSWHRRLLAIFTVFFGCVAANAFTGDVIANDIGPSLTLGFPLPFFEEVIGIVYERDFDLVALAIDIAVTLSVTLFAYPAIQKRLRAEIKFRPRFHLSTLIFAITFVAILLGLTHLYSNKGRAVQEVLATFGPFIAVGIAYFGVRWSGQDTRESTFVLLLVSMLVVYLLGPEERPFNKPLLLFQNWSIQLWLIWFVWAVEIDRLLPNIHVESETDNTSEDRDD